VKNRGKEFAERKAGIGLVLTGADDPAVSGQPRGRHFAVLLSIPAFRADLFFW